jgi:hypothetical protein
MPLTYTRIFLVFAVQHLDAAVESLSDGLSSLVTRLPYLRGHVSEVPEKGNRLAISWCPTDDEEPELGKIQPPVDMPTYDELRNTGAPLHHFANVLSPLEVMTPKTKAPVFATSYSPIDGGLILCICVHHAVMDGGGLADLGGLWARLSSNNEAGIEAEADEPLHRLSRLQRAVGDYEVSFTFDDLISRHPQHQLLSKSPAAELPQPLPKSMSKIFSFDAAKLSRAKDMLRDIVPVQKLSVNNILCGLLWSCITRVRLNRRVEGGSIHLPDEISRLGFAVNGRNRLGERFIGERYLGNVNMFGLSKHPLSILETASQFSSDNASDEEARASLGAVIDGIGGAIAHITTKHIAEVISLVEQAPNIRDVSFGWRSFHSLDLSATSWANQGFYEFDFGQHVGKPSFVRVPCVQFDGMFTVLPRKRDVGEKIEVVIFLNEKDIETLEHDPALESWF